MNEQYEQMREVVSMFDAERDDLRGLLRDAAAQLEILHGRYHHGRDDRSDTAALIRKIKAVLK